VEPNYAVTYHFCGSKAVVYVVAPPLMTEAEKQQRLREFYLAAWAAWNSLPVEERVKFNLGVDLTKILQQRLQKLIDKVEQEYQGD
jgi:hypothetical protein